MSDTDEELERLRAGCERWAAAYREVLADVEEALRLVRSIRGRWVHVDNLETMERLEQKYGRRTP